MKKLIEKLGSIIEEKKGLGAGGVCQCPKCGHKEDHETGKPCDEKKCPKCGTIMDRL